MFGWWGGRRFDQDVKFWRLFADVINDVGLTLDMVAPLCGPQLFLPVLCLARIACGLCGVSAGATRSTISVRFKGKAARGSGVQQGVELGWRVRMCAGGCLF